MIESILGIILHLDQNLAGIVHTYGLWTYLILFIIIFCETGFVITPFLPGDSLLFVSGALAASGILNLELLIAVYILGAVIGDTVNYWLGNYLGLKVFVEKFPGLVKKEYIDRTHCFYDRWGGATIFVARFVPFVRTFAPFLAGVGSMKYRRFLFYNVLGAVAWTLLLVLGGYYLGALSVVKENMSLMLLGVFILTAGAILLIIAGLISSCRRKKPDCD
ncbi:VTT domain-containing protein [Methanoregula sp. UBA64]|uniref:VTT domain-containing protein n=1 Tax=Methanoregula sp. UBA64 TaxID=1915554 RepID=UPI0025E9C3C1|nr:VTT domain-containing protein [Methanoregula sp. UBA64]